MSAGAGDATARFSHALLGSTTLLGLCLLVVAAVLLPAQRAVTASARRDRTAV